MASSPFDDVNFPPLSALPFKKGDPPGAIWGFYESIAGSDKPDELGALNLLTPKRILRASKEEIQQGRVVSLNWPLQLPVIAGYGRKNFSHRAFKKPDRYVIDDEVFMNTQSGSQWDSFSHWGYYKTGQFYNGLDVSEIVDINSNEGHPVSLDRPRRNGIHTFQGKIVGRGVLLDYVAYAESKGIQYIPCEQHFITVEDLDACAKAQGVDFRQGDILFVRMGYINWYNKADMEQRVKASDVPTHAVGVRQTEAELEWLWKHHFAAVVCDAPAFEARPCIQEWNMHDYLLALWGTPIGELFDLEALASTCKELGRTSFFVTSSPLHIVNGIASPPNALAIF